MDPKAISIGDSSSEKTHHGASNSESSSLERLTILHYVGGGTFRLHRRVQPLTSSLDGESILVTMILPSSVSGEARRSGGWDIRASPCV